MIFVCVSDWSLSIASWNCGGIWSHKHDQPLWKFLRKFDIICFQETMDRFNFAFSGYELFHEKAYVGERGGRPQEGFLIAIRQSLKFECRRVPLSTDHAMAVQLEKDGSSILLISVYIKPTEQDADTSVFEPLGDDLARLEGSFDRLVICGDFNSRIGDQTSRNDDDDDFLVFPSMSEDAVVTSRGHSLSGFLQNAGLVVANGNIPSPEGQLFPAEFTFSHRAHAGTPTTGRSCVDFFLLSADTFASSVAFETLDVAGADHSLLHLSIKMDGSRARVLRPPRKIFLPNIPLAAAHSFLADIQDQGLTGHAALESFTAFVKSEGRWVEQARSSPLTDTPEVLAKQAEVKYLRRKVRGAQAALRRSNSSDNLRILSQARTTWVEASEALSVLRSQALETIVQNLRVDHTQPGSARKLWRILRGRNAPPVSHLVELKDWANHFQQVLNKGAPPLTLFTSATIEENEVLDRIFTEEEVRYTLRNKSSHSAPGPDELTYGFWKSLTADSVFLTWLTKTLNEIFSSGQIPPAWLEGKITVLYKGKGSTRDPNNFRGISLTATILKVFETLLAKRLASWASMEGKLTWHQAGFRPFYSTADHVFLAAHIQRQYQYMDGVTALMDLKKAFPSVPRKRLLDKLDRIGVSLKLLRVLSSLYQDDVFTVHTAEGQSPVFGSSHGTKEGSCLSPILFILFMSDVPEFFADLEPDSPTLGSFSIPVLQFADDTAFFATSVPHLQRLLTRFEAYCARNELTINPVKTEIILHRPNARGRRNEEWSVGGTTIKRVVFGDYLGARLGTGRIGVHHLLKMKSRGNEKMCRLLGTLKRTGISDLRFALQLFRSLVMSSALYAVHLLLPFSQPHLAASLNPILNTFLRRFWQLPPGTNNRIVRTWANVCCMECEFRLNAWFFLVEKIRKRGLGSPVVSEELETQFQYIPVSRLPDSSSPQPYGWLWSVHEHAVRNWGFKFSAATWDEYQQQVLMVPKTTARSKALQYCHLHCGEITTDKAQLLQLVGEVADGVPPFAASNLPVMRNLRLVLSGSWRFSADYIPFRAMSKNCVTCGGVPDSIFHWVETCPDFTESRRNLALTLSPLAPTRESLPSLLSHQPSCVLLSDFVGEVLLRRKEQWTAIQAEGLDASLSD